MISYKTTHVSEAQKELLMQFWSSPNLQGTISSVVRQVQGLEDVTHEFHTKLSLDVAEGAQLDIIGRIVSLDRGNADDATYRNRLRVRILTMTSSGTQQDILEILHLRYGYGLSRWTLKDGTIAEFVVSYNDGNAPLTTTQAREMANYVKAAKAAGVRFYLEYVPVEEASGQYFSFGSLPDIEGDSFGFDYGAFSGVVEV